MHLTMHGGDNVLYHSYMTLYIIVTDIEGLRRSGPMDLHFINHSNSSQFITNTIAQVNALCSMLSSAEQVARGILEFVNTTLPRVQKSNSSGSTRIFRMLSLGSLLCQLRVLSYS